jgi:hypothetical protein
MGGGRQCGMCVADVGVPQTCGQSAGPSRIFALSDMNTAFRGVRLTMVESLSVGQLAFDTTLRTRTL